MKTQAFLLPMAAAAAVLGGCATEPGLGPTYAQAPVVCSNFGAIDADNNGLIGQNEWGGFRSAVFNDWDLNDDNRISSSEFQNCWVAGGFRNDMAFDTADWDENFGVFDDDDDGFLGPNEFFGDDEFGMFDTDDDFGIEFGLNEWGF